MGMKVGQTSPLFKGDKGLFIVRKTAERKIKPKSTPQTRITNQYLADVQNDVHLGDISADAKAYMNFVRQQDSYLLLKRYENLLPEDKTAATAMITAEYAFREGKWEQSLNGTQTFKGFKEFISMTDKETKQSRLAKMYASICYMKLNDFKSAITLLSSIQPTEDYFMSSIIPILLGDAYAMTDKPQDAISHYKNAVEKGNSNFYLGIALHKLALHYYMIGDYNKTMEACRLLLERNVGHHHGQVLTELLKKLETQYGE
jgi:tetratricopeptide (TPR) repeat protein